MIHMRKLTKYYRGDTYETLALSDINIDIKGQKSNYGSLSLEEKLEWWKNTDK